MYNLLIWVGIFIKFIINNLKYIKIIDEIYSRYFENFNSPY